MNDHANLDAQILDAAADALICADRSGAIMRWNRAAELLLAILPTKRSAKTSI
jgi:PAS domain-containing protein